MAASLIVLVLVAAGDAHDPSVVALVATAEEALGPGTIVVVREAATTANDAAALAVGGALHADALVEVSWPDPERLRATLHVHPSKDAAGWTDRELAFAPVDAAPERGRTLGFAVASMIPAATADGASTPAPPTAPTPAAPKPPARIADTLPPRAAAASADSTEAAGATRLRRLGLELDGIAVGDGATTALGGALTGSLALSSSLSMRLGGGARYGSLAAANATTTTLRAHVGLGWQPLRDASSGLALGARGHVVAVRHQLTRVDPPETGARWVPAFDLEVEATWSFVQAAELLVAGGGEVDFASTRVLVGADTVATIPAARLLAEIGIRARF